MADRKTIIIIALIIVLIAMVCILGYAVLFNQNHYQRVNISETCSLEVPVGKGINGFYVNDTSIYQVTNGEGVSIMCYNSKNNDLASVFGFAVVKEMAVGSRFTEDAVYQTTINGSTVWSIATGNDDTHDNILISTPDKDLTLRIYESIKYNNKTIKNDSVIFISNNTNNNNPKVNDTSNNPSSHISNGYVDEDGFYHADPNYDGFQFYDGAYVGKDYEYAYRETPIESGQSSASSSQGSGGSSSSEGSVVTTTG